MEAHRLDRLSRRWCRRELLHHDRAVDEGAGSQVLDVRIAEHLRQARGTDGVRPWRRQLASVVERGPPVVGPHEAGEADWVEREPAEVVEADDDVRPVASSAIAISDCVFATGVSSLQTAAGHGSNCASPRSESSARICSANAPIVESLGAGTSSPLSLFADATADAAIAQTAMRTTTGRVIGNPSVK
jgi:hypothetical protein